MILASVVGGLLIIGGTVALIMYLRTPPPPPWYQRPIPLACLAVVSAFLGYVLFSKTKEAVGPKQRVATKDKDSMVYSGGVKYDR